MVSLGTNPGVANHTVIHEGVTLIQITRHVLRAFRTTICLHYTRSGDVLELDCDGAFIRIFPFVLRWKNLYLV
jgi:hypothetical protein